MLDPTKKDVKFRDWYGIIGGYQSRTGTIMEGISAYALWWAARYGHYQHADFRISDEGCKPQKITPADAEKSGSR
jgi:hypothetical protein